MPNTSMPRKKTEPSQSRSVNQTRATLELVFAGALWGFGFIAAVWALKAMGPLSVTALRFGVAAAIGLAIAMIVPGLRSQLSWEQCRLAITPGILLSLTLIFQTWGLKHTTATKSGFITTLYVLFVPLLERWWLRRTLPKFHLLYVGIGLFGVALICDFGKAFTSPFLDFSAGAWNIGDGLTLLCAVAASFQIVWFAKIQSRIGSSFLFNIYQSIWAGLLPLILLLGGTESTPDRSAGWLPWIGLGMLIFGSTLVAFALQIRAQKTISPSIASLLFLLESPFATLFAIYFLNEHLRTDQWVGAGLILMAAILSTLVAVEKTRSSYEKKLGSSP